MGTAETSQANGQSNELKCHKTNKVNGIKNWMMLFLTIFIARYIIENIITYGIIKSPIQLTYDCIEYMQENWWYFAMVMFGYLFQILLAFLNEKCLAVGILSEKVGMALHLFIFLFLFNLCSIVSYVYKINPVAGILAISHIFLLSLKFLGYAFENRKLRYIYKSNMGMDNFDANGKSGGNGTVKYPDNVNLKNIFQFIFCTAACRYSVNVSSRQPANYRKVFTGIVYMILILYAVAFILYQFILPELNNTAMHIDNRQYLQVFGSVLKLAFPVNMAWILYFHFYYFKFYLPMFGWFWGVEDIVFARDWWNSENSTVYWTKWNYLVHMLFKENLFVPLLQMGYSKRMAGFIVACFSGVLHEYLMPIPCRCCYGAATLVMIGQIQLASITGYAQRNYGAKWGNLLLWSSLVLGHPICLIFLHYNYPSS